MIRAIGSRGARSRLGILSLGSLLALAFAFVTTSLSESGAPKLGEAKSISPDGAPYAGSAPDWKESAGKWKATSGGVAGTLTDGALKVENMDGVLTFKCTEIAWGGASEPFTKDKTSFTGKNAKIKWTPDIEEKFVVRELGFEHFIEIKKATAEGDLEIAGTIDTDLKIEETFDGTPGATEFTMSGPAVFLNKWKKRALGIGRTWALDAEGNSHVCSVSYAKTPGGYSFTVHVPAAWIEKAVFPISIDPLIGTPSSASWANGQEDWPSAVTYGNEKFLVV